MRGDVARAARVRVVAPCSAQVVGAFQHGDVGDTILCEPDGGTEPAEPGTGEGIVVGVKGLRWDPEKVTVKLGDTVRWKWDENLAHNVESESDEDFGTDKKNLQKADFTHLFDEAGTYDYTCTLHTNMDGTIEVEE